MSVVARLVQLTDDGDVARSFDVADKELTIGRYETRDARDAENETLAEGNASPPREPRDD